MKIPLVDAHFHLDLFPSEIQALREIRDLNIKTIAVTNAPSVFFHTFNLSQQENLICPAIGLHPELVSTHAGELKDFSLWLKKTRFVGEIGLDYAVTHKNSYKLQIEVFTKILELCEGLEDKVLSVHSRGAVEDVLSCISKNLARNTILHWFTGSLTQARKAINLGCYFSVNIQMLNTVKGHNLIQLLPKERILTESDSPFVKHNNLPFSPASMIRTVQEIGKIWGESEEVTAHIIDSNFTRMIGSRSSS